MSHMLDAKRGREALGGADAAEDGSPEDVRALKRASSSGGQLSPTVFSGFAFNSSSTITTAAQGLHPLGSPGSSSSSLAPPVPSKFLRCFVRKEGYLTYHPTQTEHCVHFSKFVERFGEAEIAGFFRDLLVDLSVKKIENFHLQIVGSTHSGPSGFFVEVTYGQKFDGPPEIPLEKCIACQPEAEIFPGMTSQETYLLEYDTLHMKVSLDAQARAAFVITPLRHCCSLSELDDKELADLWRTAAKLMRKEKLHFSRMVVNHGTYRNLPHLHLKIFINQKAFDKSRESWSPERTAIWKKMCSLKPAKSSSICKFYKIHGRCKYGSQCRHIHANDTE